MLGLSRVNESGGLPEKELGVLCAHTVRRLKPGRLEQFEEAFRPGVGVAPGWVRFHVWRGLADEVVTFGFFDGTLEDVERSRADGDYEGRRAVIEPYVVGVLAIGVYEVEVSWVPEGAPAT